MGLDTKVDSSTPVIKNDLTEGTYDLSIHADPAALLLRQFSKALKPDAIKETLRPLEGVWEYVFPGLQSYSLAHPVFNIHGDLILELRPFGQHGSAVTGVTSGRLVSGRPGVSTRRVSSFAARLGV